MPEAEPSYTFAHCGARNTVLVKKIQNACIDRNAFVPRTIAQIDGYFDRFAGSQHGTSFQPHSFVQGRRASNQRGSTSSVTPEWFGCKRSLYTISASAAPHHVAPRPRSKLPNAYNAASAKAPERSVASVSHSNV